MTDTPSLYGSAATPDDLVALLRQRKQELKLSDKELDRIAGLTDGHTGKLLGPARVKHFGEFSLFTMLGALGLRIALEVDAKALQQFHALADMSEQSSRMLARASMEPYSVGQLGEKVIRRALVMAGKNNAKAGGYARKSRLTKKRRTKIARRAARKRWSKHRIEHPIKMQLRFTKDANAEINRLLKEGERKNRFVYAAISSELAKRKAKALTPPMK